MHSVPSQGQIKAQSYYVEERELSYKVGPCLEISGLCKTSQGRHSKEMQGLASVSRIGCPFSLVFLGFSMPLDTLP